MHDNLTSNTQLKLDKLSNKLENLIENKVNDKVKIENLEKKMNKIENFISYRSEKEPTPNTELKSSFRNFVRSGQLKSNLVFKSLTVGNSEGGALIKHDLYNQIMNSVSEHSVMRNLASVEKISGSFLEIVKEKGNFAAGWVDEIDKRDNTIAAELFKQKIFLHEIYAQPKATQKLIEDSYIDIEAWIKEKITSSFISLENEAFIKGNGQKKPFGLMSYKQDLEIKKIDISETLTADSLLKMINSLKSEFLSNASFLLNRVTLSKIQSLKDSSGRFIWQHSLTDALNQTIFGFPVICCTNMPDMEKNNVPIIFGDFKAAYKIIDKDEISLVRDPYTEKPFIKFYTVKRVGGDIINKDALVFAKVL